MTQRDGDTLSEGQAAPFVVNFKLVDADGDGKITEAEFKQGCQKGLVQEASAEGSQQPAGKGRLEARQRQLTHNRHDPSISLKRARSSAYEEAVKLRPGKLIRLRQKARVIKKSR